MYLFNNSGCSWITQWEPSGILLIVKSGTGSGQLVMQIYGAKDGELAWRMSKEMNEGAFSSANELMERMMRKVGRLFPFEK